MGDLPLRTPTDRCLGGPLPRQQANQTHPHPLAASLWYELDVCFAQHRVLIRFSPGYPLLKGRLDTRYSPVRRSPSLVASNQHAAPRLACVKPVASVHPEPGSNSSLYSLFLATLPDNAPTGPTDNGRYSVTGRIPSSLGKERKLLFSHGTTSHRDACDGSFYIPGNAHTVRLRFLYYFLLSM